MLAGEMDSAFRPRNVGLERQHLPWQEIRNSTARPEIATPDLHNTAFVVLPDAGIHVFDRVQSEAELLESRRPPEFASLGSLNKRHQDAAPAVLAVRAIPHLHRVIGVCEAAESFIHPVAGA